MRTHHIEVKAMMNPAGAVFATLDITVSNHKDSVEFVYSESLRANGGIEFFEAFEETFAETLQQKRPPGLRPLELRVVVGELSTDPENSPRVAFAGYIAAVELLKKESSSVTEIVLPHEVDELTHYIFHNYSSLMTIAEKGAYNVLMVERKTERSSTGMKHHLEGRFGSSAPEVARLLAGGARKFLISTRDRILMDHASEVFLNRCAKCGALARTPQACLCPKCNHTWYEKRNV